MISVAELTQQLGYDGSPNFLTGGALTRIPSLAHVFRRAEQDCGLTGVYALRQDASRPDGSLVPVVYVCEAESEEAAQRIHRRVWNQDVVPFVIVRTPENVRVYSGFGYRAEADAPRRTASRILNEAVSANEIASKLAASFRADRIDDGTLWRQKGQFVTPDLRVDGRLLGSLEQLGKVLRDDMKLDPHVAHALIGKYVYLRYLRDRDILSDKRLAEFKVEERSVFTRDAQLRRSARLSINWTTGSTARCSTFPGPRGLRRSTSRKLPGHSSGTTREPAN